MKIHQHYFEKRLKLGQSIAGKKKVFLDTNFWVNLRDVSLCRSKDKKWLKLFYILNSIVEEDRAVLPVSREILIEVFKQTDPVTLVETVALIDRFSSGVSVIPPYERMEEEVFNVIKALQLCESETQKANNLVWTKLNFCVVPVLNSVTTASYKDAAFWVDKIWNKTLIDRVQELGMNAILEFPKFPDLSIALNENKKSLAGTVSSQKQIYLSELSYTLDECRPILDNLVRKGRIGTNKSSDEDTSLNILHSEVAGFIYEALQQGEALAELPSFHIPSAIIAAVCWDQKRPFKANDWLDFAHADAAIPYCDVFLTEKPLKSIVMRSDIRLHAEYNCAVFCTVDQAIDYFTSQNWQ